MSTGINQPGRTGVCGLLLVPLSLRNKTLLLIAASRLTLSVLVFLVCRAIIVNSFAELEIRDAREHVLRVQSALEDEFANLESVAGDWAPWTDSYDFVQGDNDTYVEDNLIDATFANLRLNIMVFLDSDGNIVYAKAYDMQAEAEVPVPPALSGWLSADDTLLRHDSIDSAVTGIIPLPGAPMLVASRPIVTSNYEGPIAGTLIVGRSLDEALIAEVSARTRLDVSHDLPDNSALVPGFRQALDALDDNLPIFVQPVDDQTISGYFLVKDLSGAPASIVRVDTARNLYKSGQDMLGYLVLSVTIVGVMIGAAILFILEKYVLARLSSLTESVSKVGRSGDRFARVSLPQGEDELRQLAITINDMLESLQQSEAQLHQSKVLLKEVHHRVKNNLQVVSSLLSLQSVAITDHQLIQVLKDCQHRIESIALVHEKLYSSTELSLVDVGEYTRSLIDKLRDSMVMSHSVQVTVSADPILLDVDRAVPIGLILSELITNALKYAFPDGLFGEINVELRAIDETRFVITVRDDGVGLPEDLDIHRTNSLGLQLVSGLTAQLDGTVELRREGGAAFELRFTNSRSNEEERR